MHTDSNTDCRNIRERLGLLLDGSLDPNEAESLREHLDSCDECRREEHLLRQTVSAIGSLRPVRVPDTFRHEVRKRVRDEAVRREARRIVYRGMALAATVALGVGLAIGMSVGNLTGGASSQMADAGMAADGGAGRFENSIGTQLGTVPVAASQEPLRQGGAQPGVPADGRDGGQLYRVGEPVYLGGTDDRIVPRDYYLDPENWQQDEKGEQLPAVIRARF